MKIKRIEITCLDFAIHIKTDEIIYIKDGRAEGVQGDGDNAEICLQPLYHNLAEAVEMILKSSHTQYREMKNWNDKGRK